MFHRKSYTLNIDERTSSGNLLKGRVSRYRWTSNWNYLITFVIYSLYSSNRFLYLDIAVTYDIEYMQSILCVFLVSLPIIYMLTALGQYSQSSCTRLRYLSPVMHGVGYSYLFVTFIRMTRSAVLAGDALLYSFNAMQYYLPWVSCEHYKNCWFGEECVVGPCLNETISLATSRYWNETFMAFPSTMHHSFGMPDFRRLISIVIMWIIIYKLLFFKNKFGKFCRFIIILYVISFVISISMIFWMFVSYGSGKYGFSYMIETTLDGIGDYYQWSRTVLSVLVYTSVGKGGHMILGSFFPPRTHTGLLTLSGTALVFLGHSVMSLMRYVAMSVISQESKSPNMRAVFQNSPYELLSFTVIPAGIAYITAYQIWSTLYFVIMILQSVSHILLNLRLILISLEDAFPLIEKYKLYTLIASFLLYLLLAIPCATTEYFYITSCYLSVALDWFEMIITTLTVLVVSWIYGVQKLCDDIHFICGSPPTRFWKVTWYISPLVLAISIFFYLWQVAQILTANEVICITAIVLILASPIIIYAFIESVRYLKWRDLFGLFQMTESWGPEDEVGRHERNIFNPRRDIKSRRRAELCQHKCLRNSKVLARVIAMEERLRTINETPQQLDNTAFELY